VKETRQIMKTRFLPAYFKKIGYISLIVAVTVYFISGLLGYFPKERPYMIIEPFFIFGSFFKQFPLSIFLFSIFSIRFSADPKGSISTGNRLLLPHYFKVVGYIFLVITLIIYISIKNNVFESKQVFTLSYEADEKYDRYQARMSAQQKKDYLSIEGVTKKVMKHTLTTNSITLILPVGLLFLAFSKEKIEDELITSYRAQSLQLAILLLFFLILYQKLNVPETTLVVTGKNGFSYFDLPGSAWKADILINVILIFSIVRMEYLLRIKPLFNKKNV
jgi:hypothetical protein